MSDFKIELNIEQLNDMIEQVLYGLVDNRYLHHDVRVEAEYNDGQLRFKIGRWSDDEASAHEMSVAEELIKTYREQLETDNDER